jgi:hypothetical protein
MTGYISLHFLNSLTLKFVALHGYPVYHTLFFRGLACLTLGALLAWKNSASIIPKEPRVQITRFFFAGFSLLLIISAYQYANGTTVSIISRMDTPFLIILGPWIAVSVSRLQQGLACLSTLLIFGLAVFLRGSNELAVGYVLAIVGTVGLTLGYLLLRSSARSENIYVIAVTGGCAIIFYGAIGSLVFEFPFHFSEWKLALVSCFAGGIMFGTYDLTVRLYRIMDITLAEYPTLIAAVLVLPAEAMLFNVHFDIGYVVCMLSNVIMIGAILYFGRPKKKEAARAAA